MKPSSLRKERVRLEKMSCYEKELWEQERRVAGIDEAGRGPLAGPVVSAAVILPENYLLPGLNDSKKVTARRREELYGRIEEEAIAVGVGIVSEVLVDKLNILRATFLAMEHAVKNLGIVPQYLLVDGFALPAIHISQKAIPGGDGLSISIAAASIVAKVTRDRIMVEYNGRFPHYGFARHKGYGTRMHLEALARYGPCSIHRRSFRPVARYL